MTVTIVSTIKTLIIILLTVHLIIKQKLQNKLSINNAYNIQVYILLIDKNKVTNNNEFKHLRKNGEGGEREGGKLGI